VIQISVVTEVKMGDKQKIFFTVQTPPEQNQAESNVSFHDYSQIQIVNAISTSPAKKKFIFVSEGEEGTEVYDQQYVGQGGSFSFTEASGKAPLILDPNVSGAVESVIEVTNHENISTVADIQDVQNVHEVVTLGKTEEVQTFSFEDEKFALMEEEDDETEDSGLIKPFECELCKKQFTKIEILKRHIKTHMKEKEFKCSYCPKTFDRRDVLNDHVRNHTGEKPFQCTTCNKKFTRGFVLLRHMRTHAEGVYKCDFCFKSFDRKDTYRDHMRNHTGEKPFKCRFCGKAFSRSFVLTKHEKSHVIREELGNENSLDIVDSDTVLVEEIDYEDEESVKQATDLLLQRELGEEVIQDNVEQEIIQDEQDFKIIEHQDIVSMDDNLVCEPAVEEVVETEAITLATADGQIVRVISKEQYERLLAGAGKLKTYRCDTCNKTFTNYGHFQQHFSLRWELGGCIN